jgi:holo-[acyl-carrier protein] synthase
VKVGIDVVDVDRLRALLERSPDIQARLFTPREAAYCYAKQDPLPHLAGRVAAKEAVIKAMCAGTLVSWARRIEIDSVKGAPIVSVDGKIKSGLTVSISHDGPVAAAVALMMDS